MQKELQMERILTSRAPEVKESLVSKRNRQEMGLKKSVRARHIPDTWSAT